MYYIGMQVVTTKSGNTVTCAVLYSGKQVVAYFPAYMNDYFVPSLKEAKALCK